MAEMELVYAMVEEVRTVPAVDDTMCCQKGS